jgi:hypothetical protein
LGSKFIALPGAEICQVLNSLLYGCNKGFAVEFIKEGELA